MKKLILRQLGVNKMQFHWPWQEYWLWIRINLHVKRQHPFSLQFLVCIYRLKCDAFSDNNNFVDNLKILIFDIDNLPIIWKMLIYRLSIIFSIVSPTPNHHWFNGRNVEIEALQALGDGTVVSSIHLTPGRRCNFTLDLSNFILDLSNFTLDLSNITLHLSNFIFDLSNFVLVLLSSLLHTYF